MKDAEHLLEKIVRKRAEGNTKYSDISSNNYFECITDLVGIRALHLFKEDCLGIDEGIKSLWSPIETPVVYKRAGDNDQLSDKFKEKGFEIKDHPAGYRSVHYVIESRPLNRKIITEVQVRTIFEEGWSEIDHKVRYPNFSDNELVGYFLGIFNRMAASADEMGGFVPELAATIKHLEKQVSAERNEKEATLRDIEQTLNELENVKEQGKAARESIAKLKAEVAKLKEINKVGAISLPLPSQGLHGAIRFKGSDASEQAARGLLGFGALEQATRNGLLGSSALEQATRNGLLGSIGLEQATRDHLLPKDKG